MTAPTTAAPTTGAAAPPNVTGLDLSMTATGVAYLAAGQLVTATIRPTPGIGDQRLLYIAEHVGLAVGINGQTDLAMVEDLPTHAHGAGITGMVHGAIRMTLLTLGVPYALVTPASLKKYATGKGNATKADMRMALFQRAGLDLRDDNQVDAWWLRAAGLDHLGHPLVTLPKAQREALAKVAWPQAVNAA
ncbi:hypothetical protein ACIBQX_18910 [Nonomuraea sp. NPDC049714]|uniref:hypothetical protein n=1 Tax=Nonomuraea sp. NPDC049714 TaxID=3364357 RepID=UPI0037A234E6